MRINYMLFNELYNNNENKCQNCYNKVHGMKTFDSLTYEEKFDSLTDCCSQEFLSKLLWLLL